MAVIKMQAAEHLVGAVAQLRHQERARGLRRGQYGSYAHRFAKVTPAELESGLDQTIAGRPKAALAYEPGTLQGQKCAQGSEFHEEMASELNRRVAAHARTQEHCEELGLGERLCASVDELFARSFILRPVSNAHHTLLLLTAVWNPDGPQRDAQNLRRSRERDAFTDCRRAGSLAGVSFAKTRAASLRT